MSCNASLSLADYVIIVTEPTVSGFHDLKRLVELLKAFKIRSGIVINKYDLNETKTIQIFKYAENEKIPILGSIPFDIRFVKALIRGKNVVEVHEDIREQILTIFNQLELQVALSIN